MIGSENGDRLPEYRIVWQIFLRGGSVVTTTFNTGHTHKPSAWKYVYRVLSDMTSEADYIDIEDNVRLRREDISALQYRMEAHTDFEEDEE